MKIEFLPDGAPNCPLIRIYDLNRASACHLQGVFAELASGRIESVALHELPNAEAVNGCRLTAEVGPTDQGVLVIMEKPNSFVCILSTGTWENIADLTEPFCKSEATGFQWLDETSNISLLLSRTGSW